MPGARFSLLLLEPGEIYFEDFSVTYTQKDGKHPPLRGRLRICSRSLIFEPLDVKYPIYRINLSNCQLIQSMHPQTETLLIECSQVVEMLANNSVSPYHFRKEKCTVEFSFHYATCEECLHHLSQLHRASSLATKDQQEMIEAIVHSRYSRVMFDPCWLEDLHETILFESRVIQVSPLVSNPGRVVWTSASRLYYQPYNSEPWPVLKIRSCDIERVVRRRYLLQNSALEIYCKGHLPTKYLFLALDDIALCDQLLQKLEQKQRTSSDIEVATLQWQCGILSNYDYLLYLNSSADRSFNDLTQYPVFPWVIKDFTSPTLSLDDPSIYRDLSKPIGALNPFRLEQLFARFQDMPEPRFLYGSHYMAPGFVLFYLARKYPQLVLCLHGGRFDHPDRMFNSVQQTWSNVYHGSADYKELVPEFYGDDGDFLVNYLGVDFGTRSDGRPIQDVELPPWAKTPSEFTAKLRQALESENVSRNLHHWIDLIFGCLQRGPNALAAKNLFHPLCYEGSVDLGSIRDTTIRHTYEIQIQEFGQIPRQIFNHPHPPRFGGLIPTPISREPRFNLSAEPDRHGPRSWSRGRLSDLQLDAIFQGHKRDVTTVTFIDENNAISISLDGFLKVYKLSDGKQTLSVNPVESSPLTTCLSIPNSNIVVLGTLQNEVALYQLSYCRLESVAHVHDDSITTLGLGHDGDDFILASGSSDCSVKLWRLRQIGQPTHPDYRFRSPSDLLNELEHDSAVSSLDFDNSPISKLVTGTKEGQILLWDIKSGQILTCLPGHSRTVTGIKFSPEGSKLVTAGQDGLIQVFQVNVFPPQTLARTIDAVRDFRCLAWDGLSIFLGSADGDLLLFDLVEVKIMKKIKAHTGALVSIDVSSEGGAVVTTGEDARVCIWKPKPNPH